MKYKIKIQGMNYFRIICGLIFVFDSGGFLQLVSYRPDGPRLADLVYGCIIGLAGNLYIFYAISQLGIKVSEEKP